MNKKSKKRSFFLNYKLDHDHYCTMIPSRSVKPIRNYFSMFSINTAEIDE